MIHYLLYVTEYDEWDHIVRIAMLVLFQYVMTNWRSNAIANRGTDVTLRTLRRSDDI